MSIQHKDIADPNIHEAKGASTATAGQVLTATGSGTSTWALPTVYSSVAAGSYDVGDTATTGTPIALSVAGTLYDLTNNALGANTGSYPVAGVSSVWNTGTNRFDFSALALGDMVLVSVDLSYVTTVANSALNVFIELGVGTGGVYSIALELEKNFKLVGTHRAVYQKFISLRDATTKNNPARIRVSADQTGSTMIVNDFLVQVIKR